MEGNTTGIATQSERKDITTREDIRLLVDTFYGRGRKDELIGPVFERTLEGRWPQHFQKMYRFWETMLLDERTYKGQPFMPHAPLPLDERHFERWLQLWHATLNEFFDGPVAEEARQRSLMIAEVFKFRMGLIERPNLQPFQ